jgi:hypothetical protein
MAVQAAVPSAKSSGLAMNCVAAANSPGLYERSQTKPKKWTRSRASGAPRTEQHSCRHSSEKRLARTLLLLANFGKEGRPEPIIAKVSQETLAEMIGTTRSRVSFFMNKFRKLGLIDYNGSIEIHSSLLNVVLRDQPQINR